MLLVVRGHVVLMRPQLWHSSPSCLRELRINELQDSGGELLCEVLQSPQCWPSANIPLHVSLTTETQSCSCITYVLARCPRRRRRRSNGSTLSSSVHQQGRAQPLCAERPPVFVILFFSCSFEMSPCDIQCTHKWGHIVLFLRHRDQTKQTKTHPKCKPSNSQTKYSPFVFFVYRSLFLILAGHTFAIPELLFVVLAQTCGVGGFSGPPSYWIKCFWVTATCPCPQADLKQTDFRSWWRDTQAGRRFLIHTLDIEL